MANDNVKLDLMLRSILSVANEDQNFFYSPKIYSDQYNAVTGLLLSELCKVFPSRQDLFDMIFPFMETQVIMVKNGYIELPDNYRNLLGSPSISVRPDGSSLCDKPIIIDTESEFKVANLKGGCKSRPVKMVPISEWDYLTSSTYNFPTYNDPIGCFFSTKRFKVCPYDIGKVEVRYARQEKKVLYNYISQPDDTFLFNPIGSEESEWTNAAFTPLFNGLVTLYSAYAKDNELTNWAVILSQKGIL